MQVFLYEWKNASNCYVPLDDANCLDAGGLPLDEMIRRAVVIWKLDKYTKILNGQTDPENISPKLLTERIDRVRFLFSEINERTHSEPAVQKNGESEKIPENRVAALNSEKTDTTAQMVDQVIRYVAYRIKKNTLDQTVGPGTVSPKSAQVLSLQELTQLFIDASAAEEKRRQFDDLNAGMEQLERVTAKMEDELKTELHTVTIQMNEKRPWALKVNEYEKELELHHRELVRMQKTQEKQKHILEQGLQDKIRLEFLERWIAEHKIYVEEKLEEIERVQRSVCPGCEQTLGEDQRAQMKKSIQNQIDAFNEKIFQYQIEIDEIRHAMDKLRGTYAELDKEMKQQPVVWHQYYVTEHRLQIARQHEKEYQALKEQSERLKMSLQNRSFARREQQAIDDLRKQIQTNGYQPSQLTAVYQKIRNAIEQPAAGGFFQDGQSNISEIEKERINVLEKKEAIKNQLSCMRDYFPADLTPEELFQSSSLDELIRTAARIINSVQSDPAGLNRSQNITQQAQGVNRRQQSQQPSFAIVGKMVVDALDKFMKELEAIRSSATGQEPERLLKATAVFRCSVSRDLMTWIAGDSYGTWVCEELYNGGISLGVKRGSGIIAAENLPEPVRACAGFCMSVAGSIAGDNESCDTGAVLFAEVSFLLHESDFINKIRVLMNELMFWMSRIIIITPYTPDPAGDGVEYQFHYGSGGIRIMSPNFPKA